MGKEDELSIDEEEDDENLIEEISYSRKADFSKAGAVQEGLSKVKESRAQEMRTGYWNIATAKDGSVKKTYIPDTRKVYIGSVEYLKGLLTPEIRTSKKAIESLKNFREQKLIAFKKYSVNAVSVFNNEIVDISEKYIPDVDEIFPEEVIMRGKRFKMMGRCIVERKGLYNWKVKMYWDKMVIIYDKLFEVLNSLIAEKEFFKSKSSF